MRALFSFFILICGLSPLMGPIAPKAPPQEWFDSTVEPPNYPYPFAHGNTPAAPPINPNSDPFDLRNETETWVKTYSECWNKLEFQKATEHEEIFAAGFGWIATPDNQPGAVAEELNAPNLLYTIDRCAMNQPKPGLPREVRITSGVKKSSLDRLFSASVYWKLERPDIVTSTFEELELYTKYADIEQLVRLYSASRKHGFSKKLTLDRVAFVAKNKGRSNAEITNPELAGQCQIAEQCRVPLKCIRRVSGYAEKLLGLEPGSEEFLIEDTHISILAVYSKNFSWLRGWVIDSRFFHDERLLKWVSDRHTAILTTEKRLIKDNNWKAIAHEIGTYWMAMREICAPLKMKLVLPDQMPEALSDLQSD